MNLSQIWKDRQFGAAIAAAPFFWGVMLALGYGPAGWSYPLEEPQAWLRFALLYPVLEELAFRGLVQESLLRLTWGKRRVGLVSAANAVTSVLFASSHLIFHSPWRAAGVFFPSLVFGHFRDRYGSLRPPIFLHILYNAGFMLFFPG